MRNIGLTVRDDWRPTQAQARLLAIVRETANQLGRHSGAA
jgi:hypothetical protein